MWSLCILIVAFFAVIALSRDNTSILPPYALAWMAVSCYASAIMSRDTEIRAQLERQWAELELGAEIHWEDDLMWRPSQCYASMMYGEVHYVLYLRWRWDDPWQGHVITNARTSSDVSKKHTEWSEDLFEQRGLFFRDEELDQAKAALLKIFLEQVTGSIASQQ